MKLVKTGMMAFVLAGGMISLAPGQVHAQSYSVTEKVSFSGNYYEAGASSGPASNGSGKTTSAKKFTITTSELLTYAWNAETNIGNVSGKVAKNAAIIFNGSLTSPDLALYEGTNQVADLSSDGILTLAQTGTNDISGIGDYGTNGAGEAPFETTTLTLATVTFTTEQLTFYATGFTTIVQTVGSPNKEGNLTVSGSLNLSDGTGEGTDASGNPFELTGFTMTASGKQTQTGGGG